MKVLILAATLFLAGCNKVATPNRDYVMFNEHLRAVYCGRSFDYLLNSYKKVALIVYRSRGAAPLYIVREYKFLRAELLSNNKPCGGL